MWMESLNAVADRLAGGNNWGITRRKKSELKIKVEYTKLNEIYFLQK